MQSNSFHSLFSREDACPFVGNRDGARFIPSGSKHAPSTVFQCSLRYPAPSIEPASTPSGSSPSTTICAGAHQSVHLSVTLFGISGAAVAAARWLRTRLTDFGAVNSQRAPRRPRQAQRKATLRSWCAVKRALLQLMMSMNRIEEACVKRKKSKAEFCLCLY